MNPRTFLYAIIHSSALKYFPLPLSIKESCVSVCCLSVCPGPGLNVLQDPTDVLQKIEVPLPESSQNLEYINLCFLQKSILIKIQTRAYFQ